MGGRKRPRASAAERRAAGRRRALRRRLAYGLSAAALAGVVALVVVGGGEGGAGPAAPAEVEAGGPARTAPLSAGEAVPDFSAPGLGGGRVVWHEEATGPTVLVVWAPWCPHCQSELPVLGRVARDFPGVRVVSVVTAIGDRPGPDPGAFLEEHGLSFPTAVDDQAGTLAAALGIRGFPTVYYVGADGVVQQAVEGEVGEEGLRASFRALAGTPAA